ncbi:hypothetical protein SAMN05444169_7629 [Bradyrhizobium erythrophlei]|uniref:Uncharacterized protein n=1 Tax=Bradyrhizobium erythrophlei TaxID=1437360 RepID=A0A1M5T9G2_9BRAD|nr:hypothetical protein SAMN05444169_7629 [Bradyrhizobium erythrophlei]
MDFDIAFYVFSLIFALTIAAPIAAISVLFF